MKRELNKKCMEVFVGIDFKPIQRNVSGFSDTHNRNYNNNYNSSSGAMFDFLHFQEEETDDDSDYEPER